HRLHHLALRRDVLPRLEPDHARLRRGRPPGRARHRAVHRRGDEADERDRVRDLGRDPRNPRGERPPRRVRRPALQGPKALVFKKVLIANRGEIALRVIQACRELGVKTVAVHSDVDSEAIHARFADEAVCIGPGPAQQSYLNVPSIIAAAEITGADAIHPGYGFLSEDSAFARICGQAGLTFIGPTPENMAQWGDKVSARRLAKRLGLPLMEGSEVLEDAEDAARTGEAVGYPVM